jgi:hypothetical protein
MAAQPRQWQWQHGGGSGAEVAAVAAVLQQQSAWRRRGQLGGSATLAVRAARWEARQQHGGGNRVSSGNMT